ncbi:MAG: helix-turn-helix domain containing protein, partial [Holosporaceae bacterium]|nr:helix-turn-helix domain containing protein [Holosporaceae bacterium]
MQKLLSLLIRIYQKTLYGFHTYVEVAEIFHISEKTIRNWVKQRKKTGNLQKKSPERKAFKL